MPSAPASSSARVSGHRICIDRINRCIDSILSANNADLASDRMLSAALDLMHGVSKTILQTILLTVRCSVDVIHERHDALFGGRHPALNLLTMPALTNCMIENHFDIVAENSEVRHSFGAFLAVFFFWEGVFGDSPFNCMKTAPPATTLRAGGAASCYQVDSRSITVGVVQKDCV